MRTLVIPASCALALLALSAAPARSDPASDELVLRSDDITSEQPIAEEFTCDGADHSPALEWEGTPEGTGAFALVVDDPDAPKGPFVHWVAWDIPGAAGALTSAVPRETELGDGTLQGRNGFDRVGWSGPCPPKGSTHNYRFRLFALDDPLDLPPETDTEKVIRAAEENATASAELRAPYSR